jgi:hypothetical protein
LRLDHDDCTEAAGPTARLGLDVVGGISPGWWEQRWIGVRAEVAAVTDESFEIGSASVKLQLAARRGRFGMNAGIGPSLLLLSAPMFQLAFDSNIGVMLRDRVQIGLDLAIGANTRALVSELYVGLGAVFTL